MDKNSIGLIIPQDYTFGNTDEDTLPLDCGKKLGPVNIRFETYGTLNENQSNAILILHALSGDAHVAGYHSENDKKCGWWDDMVGPGKGFDTDKYFIVCSNVIGGCSGSTGPNSINPETGSPYNMDFPVITIADMVRAQYRLMKHLNIKQWLAIAGGSMGGMQVLEWAVSYPEHVKSAIAIATTARLSPQGIAFDWVGREAIMSDATWQKGNYKKVPEKGLATARMLAHITYLSDESMYKKFGRDLQELDQYAYDFTRNFAVESYLEYQGQRFVERFDANSYLFITRAIDYYDIASKVETESLTDAFADIQSNFMVISFSSDWLFPAYQSKEIVRALLNNNINVTYCDIESSYGHDAFLLEVETLSKLISDFVRNQHLEVTSG